MDALITDVCRNPDGSATLQLLPDNPCLPTYYLILVAAPRGIEAATGTHVWGERGYLMVGDRLWAEPVDLRVEDLDGTKISLVDPALAGDWKWEEVLGGLP